MSIQADASTRTDEASLGELLVGILNFYRKLGRLPLLMALLCSLPAMLWTASHPVFQLTAMLDTPSLTLDKWRRIEPLLTDKSLTNYNLAKSLADSDEALRQQWARRFGNATFWSKNVRYRSALRRDDIQEAPGIDLRNASTLGLELSVMAANEEHAKRLQQAMISQIREAIRLEGVRNLIHDRQNLIIDKRPALQLRLFDKQLATQLNRDRINDMKRLLDRYPELRKIERNTVVSVQDGGGRFLSPLAQIVALESAISEDASLIKATEHELERLRFYEQIIVNTDSLLQDIRSGYDLIQLLSTRTTQLQQHDASSSAAAEVRQDMMGQLQALLVKPQLLQLKANTDLPAVPISSRNPFIVGACVFVLVLLGSSVLLALYQWARRQELPAGTDWQPAQDPLFRSLPKLPRRWLLGRAGSSSDNHG